MRLLFVTDRLSFEGGADHHLRQVVEMAHSAGHDVCLATGTVRHGTPPPTGARLVTVRGLASPVDAPGRLEGFDQLLAAADVVHLQNVMNPTALRRAVEGGRSVVTVQDHRVFCPGPGRTLPDRRPCVRLMANEACADCLPDESYRRRLLQLTEERRTALVGSRLVALSSYMADELSAAGLDDTQVIPPWVEVDNRPPKKGDRFVIGGRLVRHKAPDEAWKAWKAAATGLPLLVAGTGPLEHELHGAEPLGWLAKKSLYRTLRAARALIFPGRWQEPFGILGIEALAAATPVVVATGGGTADWSDAGCLRVAAGDIGALADALTRLADEPETASRLGIEGRDMVAEKFAPSRVEPLLLALWAEVAEG